MFGPKKPEPPPAQPEVTEDDDLNRKLSLLEQTLAWRACGLLDLGFTIEQVLELVRRQDIVHEAEALRSRGCPPDVAFDILSE